MKNILLVDDDNIFNFINKRLLERSGLANEINTALNGEEALGLLNKYYMGKSALPDVILLDLNMPVMDGFSFLEAYKKISLPWKSKVCIIIVTSSVNAADVLKAEKLGVNQYLSKPLSEETLLDAIQRCET
jgi:CheY-like chemotaxis protein